MKLIATIACVLLVSSCGSSSTKAAKTADTTTTAAAPTTTAGPSTTATAATPSFKDGKHRVPADIAPGIYRNAKVGSGCYWARLKGFGGSTDDVIVNDNASGSAVVAILPTDAGFESTNCGTWKLGTPQITSSKTKFGEGTFVTGVDFDPGQWRNSGGSGCYWARLKSFEGGSDAVNANDNVSGQTIVQIAPTDVGFTSSNCGTWEKIG